MSVPEAEFQQGGGTPEQLPQGAAQGLNEGLAQVPEEGGAPAAAPLEEEVPETATPADYEPAYQPETDDDAFLTGPTTRPDEPVTAGVNDRADIPASLRRALPLLVDAANTPGASPQLRSLVNFLVREANR
jgi:hypothetical protein